MKKKTDRTTIVKTIVVAAIVTYIAIVAYDNTQRDQSGYYDDTTYENYGNTTEK